MKKLALAILLFVASTALFAQLNSKRTRQYLEKARQDWGVPGMAVAIVKDKEIIFNEGFGIREKNGNEMVDGQTQFAIASNTKAFVASALATLVADQKIQWNDKVVDYLPYFELYDAYVTQETTIQDLLCHRVGLGTFSGDVIWYKSQLTAEDVIKRVKHLPPAYSFRAGYGYSNLMFITAGEVIRTVTGKPWNQYVKEQFFLPLGMSRTITSISDLDTKNAATPHKSSERNKPIPWVNWDNMGAAGGIISTSTDMANWLLMNLDNGQWGSEMLLAPEQQNKLWTPHNSFVISEASPQQIPGRNFNGYGLGWGLFDYFGRKVVTHSGGYDGMYSRVLMMPKEKIGIVVLTNSMSGISLPLCLQILNDFIGEDDRDWSLDFLNRSGNEDTRIAQIKEARINDTKPSKSLSKLAGIFDAPMHGKIVVKENDGQLELSFENAPDLSAKLTHWHLDTWQINWDQSHAWFDFGLVSFLFDSKRTVTGLEFDVPNGDIFFDELVVTKVN